MKSILNYLIDNTKYSKGATIRWVGQQHTYEITGDPVFGIFKGNDTRTVPSFKADLFNNQTKNKYTQWTCPLDKIEVI